MRHLNKTIIIIVFSCFLSGCTGSASPWDNYTLGYDAGDSPSTGLYGVKD